MGFKPPNTRAADGCETHLLHPSFLGGGVDNYASCDPNAFQLLGHFCILSHSNEYVNNNEPQSPKEGVDAYSGK